MKLNHINLVVNKVEEATRFFETYFNFSCSETRGNNIVSVLKGEDGFTLVIMSNKNGEAKYPDAFHIGFMLHSENEVTETYSKLKSGGIEVGQEPRKIRESFGFYFNFQNIMIELGCYLD